MPAAAEIRSTPENHSSLSTLRALGLRIAGTRTTTRRGFALATALVIILTAPIWLRRVMHGRRAVAGSVAHRGEARPSDGAGRGMSSPAPTSAPGAASALQGGSTSKARGWDEGDWLPEAGAGRQETGPRAPASAVAAPRR